MSESSLRQLKQVMDPFSIPAQMNNIGVLIIAWVAASLNSTTKCQDPNNKPFLDFILYGSTLVCFGTLLGSILYFLGVIDYCLNKIVPCGEVCLTINTLSIFAAGLIYHCVATIYGLYEVIKGEQSQCIEYEMFKRVTCSIYVLWLAFVVCYGCFVACRGRLRTKYGRLNQQLITE